MDAKENAGFLTCPCQHCQGLIEFDSVDVGPGEGRVVSCPHCNNATVLLGLELPPLIVATGTTRPRKTTLYTIIAGIAAIILLACFLLFSRRGTYAPITGAFGWRLTEQPSRPPKYEAWGGSFGALATDGYGQGASKSGPFESVFVEMLDDHRIFRISGRTISLTDPAHDIFQEVKAGLVSKYGRPFKTGNTPPASRYWDQAINTAEWAKFTDGKSEIDLFRTVGNLENVCVVEVDYVALDLIKLAAKEQAKREHRDNTMKNL